MKKLLWTLLVLLVVITLTIACHDEPLRKWPFMFMEGILSVVGEFFRKISDVIEWVPHATKVFFDWMSRTISWARDYSLEHIEVVLYFVGGGVLLLGFLICWYKSYTPDPDSVIPYGMGSSDPPINVRIVD